MPVKSYRSTRIVSAWFEWSYLALCLVIRIFHKTSVSFLYNTNTHYSFCLNKTQRQKHLVLAHPRFADCGWLTFRVTPLRPRCRTLKFFIAYRVHKVHCWYDGRCRRAVSSWCGAPPLHVRKLCSAASRVMPYGANSRGSSS